MAGRRKGAAGRLLFNFILSTYELCSHPDMSNLLSTLSDFAVEVNFARSFSFWFLFFMSVGMWVCLWWGHVKGTLVFGPWLCVPTHSSGMWLS